MGSARSQARVVPSNKTGRLINDHFTFVSGFARLGLGAASLAQLLLGNRIMDGMAGAARRLSGDRLPLWNRCMPGPSGPVEKPRNMGEQAPRVVYFPSCASRMMGPARQDPERQPLLDRVNQ